MLTVALIVSILGFFGVQTTTFAALFAAGGVAIGVAWSGLLANFAAGTFLVVLRPFKVGDEVTAAGVTGTVESIGLFGTVINAPDNVLTIVGNNKIFSETIQNYSANPYRRVDLAATIHNTVDHDRAIRLVRRRLDTIPHVLQTPAPEVDVLQFTPAGPGAVYPPVLRAAALRPGELRHQSDDPRGLRRGRLPGAGARVRAPAPRRRRDRAGRRALERIS